MFSILLIFVTATLSQTLSNVSPNGGQVLISGGAAVSITWTATSVGNLLINIELWQNIPFAPDNKILTIASGVTASSQFHSWTVPPNMTEGTNYYIFLTDGAVFPAASAQGTDFTIALCKLVANSNGVDYYCPGGSNSFSSVNNQLTCPCNFGSNQCTTYPSSPTCVPRATTTTTGTTTTTTGVTQGSTSTTTTSSSTTTPSSSIVATVQGFSDNNCVTPNASTSSTITVASGGTCGTIFGVQNLIVISGNTATLRSCTCATSTTCGSNIGSPFTIGNGGCTSANIFAISGVTGTFKITWSSSSSAPCFHKDTMITYNKIDFTLDQLRVHPECSIPHVVEAVGVVVTASCSSIGQKTLRLTGGHLLYTQRGLQAAADLKPGKDVVYADLEEKNACLVSSVTKEVEAHEYFGLNCLNSQVLASGLKASTFEKIHSVPAFWMHVVGRILGIKRASAMGDYIADLVQKMNLI